MVKWSEPWVFWLVAPLVQYNVRAVCACEECTSRPTEKTQHWVNRQTEQIIGWPSHLHAPSLSGLQTLSGLLQCGSVSSSSEGFWMAVESRCLWITSSCLKSSWVFVSRSFCLNEMSENKVANVRPSSMAVFVLFCRVRKSKITIEA